MSPHAVLEPEKKSSILVKQTAKSAASELAPSQLRQETLFEDVLLQAGHGRARRTWATFFTLILQCVVIGFLILLPLIYTQVLPKEQLVTLLIAPPPPPPPPPPASPAVKILKAPSQFINGELRAPSSIPKKILMIKEAEAPPVLGVGGGVQGGIPGGQLGGVIGGIVGSLSQQAPELSKPPTRIRVSQGVTEGLLARKVEPTYPTIAREARIQGSVVLSAIIAKDGDVEKLQVVSGSPFLAPAAINAVKQWRYKPYLLNGAPVEVETTVTVNFHLGS